MLEGLLQTLEIGLIAAADGKRPPGTAANAEPGAFMRFVRLLFRGLFWCLVVVMALVVFCVSYVATAVWSFATTPRAAADQAPVAEFVSEAAAEPTPDPIEKNAVAPRVTPPVVPRPTPATPRYLEQFESDMRPRRDQPASYAPARTWVNGYTRKDGTKVDGHWRKK